MAETLPPLQGCLICHSEGVLSLEHIDKPSGRLASLPLGGARHPVLTCGHCGAVAWIDVQDEAQQAWRIRYRYIPEDSAYAFARRQFDTSAWFDAEEALDRSTMIFVQRQRLYQAQNGDFGWLRPMRLTPPPPLMSADEMVYLSLKPVGYYELSPKGRIPFLANQDVQLDTGMMYVTDTKIHLLGQVRDRSHRLKEISRVRFVADQWYLDITIADQPHYFQGYGEATELSAELIAAIIQVLIDRAKRS